MSGDMLHEIFAMLPIEAIEIVLPMGVAVLGSFKIQLRHESRGKLPVTLWLPFLRRSEAWQGLGPGGLLTGRRG